MQTITPDNLEGLLPIHLEQLKVSGTAYGHESSSAADTLAQTFSAEEDGRGYAEFWQVANLETNEVLYDVWVFDVDTAMVYFANTIKDVGVSMMQFSFDICEDNDELDLDELCSDLQEAYDNRSDEDEAVPNSPLGAYKQAAKNAKSNKSKEADQPTEADAAILNKLIEVDSSMLSAVKYDPDTQTLEAWFVSGDRWAYHGVPFTEFKALLESDSQGSYMRNYIIGEYDEERLGKKRKR